MSREASPEAAMEEESQTIPSFLGNLWEKLAPTYPVTVPDFWTTVFQNVKTCMEDQNSNLLSDFEKLNTVIQKITKLWKTNFKRWSVATFGELHAKTSRLLAATYQMSFSCALLLTVEDYVDGSLAADPLTLEDFTCGSTKETTTTSCMTAPGVTDRVDAVGDKKR